LSAVLNDEDYLQLARDILRAHGDVLTPSQITQKARNKKRYRYVKNLSSKLLEVILKSFQKHERIFFLSLKGKRRFGLCEWREPLPYLDCVIDGLIRRGKDVYQRKEINDVVWEVAGRVNPTQYIQRLQEEGKLSRVGYGLYKVIEPFKDDS
jgi:hypothetical protein